MKIWILILIISSVVFGGAPNTYWNDITSRREANRDQIRWGVNLGYCSGVMLNPNYLLTAGHCLPQVGAVYTSGACLSFGCSHDLKVSSVVELDTQSDYAIVKVEWLIDAASDWQNYVTSIAKSVDDYKVMEMAYTVGFPADKPKDTAWWAVGEIMHIYPEILKHIIGTINGNSGGPILRQKDDMLLGLTNGGPKELGEEGWKDCDDHPKNWNYGPRLDRLRLKSPLLLKLYP